MATKFSDFTAQAATGTTFVVGYDGTTNTQYSQNNLTNFVLDGTLSANRLVNFNSNTLQLGNQGTDGAGVKIFQDGRIEIAKWSGSFKVSGYGTQLRQNFLRLYSNTTLGATITGFATLAASSNWTDGGTGGNGFSINSRLGVIGVHNDNTSYAFRVQNSDNDELMQVRNDGVIAIGKGATLPGNFTSTVIGTNASANGNGTAIGNYATASGGGATVLGSYSSAAGSYSIAIGYDTDVAAVSSSIAIGANANVGAANSINIDASGNGSSSNNDAGTLKVYLTSNTTPSFQVDAANGMTPPTFSSNPSSPSAGNVIYNTSDNKLKFYNGTAWTDATGSADTNIYNTDGTLSGNRDVDLATNNLSFTNGEVGIGTTTFTNVGTGISGLEISDSTSGSILLRNDADDHASYWYNHSTGTYFGTKTNDKLNILQNDTVRMNISTDGNLAIGQTTTAASARLHIKGSGATFATTSLLVENFNGDDLIKVLDSGRFFIGKGAANASDNNIVYGNSANAQGTFNTVLGNLAQVQGGSYSVAIGPSATVASSSYGIAIGAAYIGGTEAISIGHSSRAHIGGLSIGHDAGTENNTGTNTMCLGRRAKHASGVDNSIILNATGSSTSTTATTSNTFSVHMTSNTGSDFKVIGNEGMIPPSITTTVRDAISSPNSGSTIYNTTDNKLQFYNGSAWTDAGGGGDNIYTADGTLSGNRAVTLGNNTLSFTTAGNGSIKLDSPVSVSRNPSLGVSMYIQGQGATSSTRSLLLENSNGGYMMSVKDDGQITIGSGATIQSTSGPQYSVVIGYGAKDKASAGNGVEAVAIGRLAVGHQNGVAIGGQAKCLGASAVAVGGSAQAKATGVSVGLQAGGPNAGSSAVSIGKFSQAKATGSIAIGTNTGLTGANSIVLNATTGVTSTTTTDTFDVFMTSASTPDLKFRTGDNVSYWNPAGETAAFGFSTTSPTATVDIDGTFRLRSASNVSNQILTADSNGNATWSDSINVNGQVKGGYESGVTTLAFDWNDGNIQKSSATGAQTFSGANAIAGSTYIIMIGTPTVTWGSSVKWPGATAPTLAGTTNIITLLYDGTSYYATSVLNYS